MHGDQKGAIFPTSIAPFQVVIVPITGADSGDAPLRTARDVLARLTASGIRVHLDDSDDRPGAKYYHWETAGVPVRIEIGRREADAGRVTIKDRLGMKAEASLTEVERDVRSHLEKFDTELRARALRMFASAFEIAHSLDELRTIHHVALVGWCGTEACGHAIEQAIDGAVLGTPETPLPIPLGAPEPCVACGRKEATQWAVAGRPI